MHVKKLIEKAYSLKLISLDRSCVFVDRRVLSLSVYSKERATSALLAEPGFSLDTVYFLIGGKDAMPEKPAPKFSFKTRKLTPKIITSY